MDFKKDVWYLMVSEVVMLTINSINYNKLTCSKGSTKDNEAVSFKPKKHRMKATAT